MRAVFAGGGSAGHLFPSLAIAQRFLRHAPDAEAMFFAARKALDEKLLAPYDHRLLSATGLPYGLSFQTLVGLLRLARAGGEALGALRGWRPQVIVGTGGYVSAAAIPAATMQGIPALTHASDALPDRTNRRLARSASRITVAFEAAAEHFPADKVIVTGQPVREEILHADRASARQARGYAPEDVVLLVTGGSQGARTLNNATLGAAAGLLGQGLKIFHQTGRADYQRIQSESEALRLGPAYVCREFEFEMGAALASADLILSRGGSSSLAEAAAWGLPMVVIPYPHADGHQKLNAAELQRKGAALVVEDDQLTPQRLAEVIGELLADAPRRQAMSQAALGWG
ncbi:MAG: UDP-N-acetylglucosamine--N-acetylmuramyl-(pentapeptide) pyrophosphoryl-undecaprenol N-acetylglucosamine transferase, partial [Armatimonadota bacterium]